MMYLGDYQANATIDFMWSSNDADGASVSRATNGEVRVYKANGTAETTTGVTDTEDFDGLTGIHHCRIATTDAFYATGNDYMVVLAGATIDGQAVNAVLAHFSIRNRYMRGTDSAYTGTPPTVGAIADAVAVRTWDEALSAHTTAGSAGKALADAGTAGDPWTAALPGSYYGGSAGYILGTLVSGPRAGAIAFIYTLTSTVDGSPIVDADVWVTADAAGHTVLASGRTNSNGAVTFYLDAGTVYVWRQKPGWNFINPDMETID
ncbi:MAG: hypothetical protein R6X18_19790 [Chloroflexota bacterium]